MGKTISEREAYKRYDSSINCTMIEWHTPNNSAANNLKDQDPTQYDCGFADFTSYLEEDGYTIEWEEE